MIERSIGRRCPELGPTAAPVQMLAENTPVSFQNDRAASIDDVEMIFIASPRLVVIAVKPGQASLRPGAACRPSSPEREEAGCIRLAPSPTLAVAHAGTVARKRARDGHT